MACSAAPLVPPLPERLDGRWNQLTRDIIQSLELQYVAFDYEDLLTVFEGLCSPRIGVGCGKGPHRSVLAAQAAVRDAGSIHGYTLIIIMFGPGGQKLRELTFAMNAVRAHATPSSTVIYAGGRDEALPPGMVRVSILTG